MARFRKTAFTAAALALMAGGASAASMTFAQQVMVQPGGPTVGAQCNTNLRTDLCNTLGEDDGDFAGGVGNGFFSLGNLDPGDVLSFDFGVHFTGPIYVYEVTGGNVANHEEAAVIELIASDLMGADHVKTVYNTDGVKVGGTTSRYEIVFDSIGGPFSSLRVQYVGTPNTTDGFDLDAIAVSAVPVPAAGLLLLAGLGGLAAARRQRG